MKPALLAALAIGGLTLSMLAAPELDFKPGFYPDHDARWKQLSDFENRADLRIDLSGHAGISLGDRQNLTLDQLKQAIAKCKTKATCLHSP